MKSRSISKITGIATSALLALSALTASAAHESNNSASLSGDDLFASGNVIVNYIAGKESWAASGSVKNLPEGMYMLVVRFNSGGTIGPFQTVCLLETNGRGDATCGNRMFDLGGFHEALVVDMDGNILLSGFFDRRGGNRVK